MRTRQGDKNVPNTNVSKHEQLFNLWMLSETLSWSHEKELLIQWQVELSLGSLERYWWPCSLKTGRILHIIINIRSLVTAQFPRMLVIFQ